MLVSLILVSPFTILDSTTQTQIKAARDRVADALRQSGATRAAAFTYGTLPGVLPQFVAYTLYRWEMNIRMAAILGFVGAGGLGQILYYQLSLLHQPQACSVVIAMLLLTLGVDLVSAKVRKGLGRAYG